MLKEKGLEFYWNEIIRLMEISQYYSKKEDEESVWIIQEKIQKATDQYFKCLKKIKLKEILYVAQNIKLIQNKYTALSEEFINNHKKIVVAASKRYSARFNDVEEDMLYLILKAFHSYNNQEIKFSSWLYQVVQQYYQNKINMAKTSKNNGSSFKHISLDTESDGDMNPRDIFGDEDNEIQDIYQKEFLEYIISNLNEFDLELLQANLKNVQFKDICEKHNLKKTTVSNRNVVFKEKLESLIWKYNR